MKSADKKAVVFDLDGTVIDTIADIASAVNRALEAFGYPERTVEEITSFLGNGSLMLIRRAIGGGTDEHCDEIRARFREEYEKGMFDLTRPYEGIPELLNELKDRGASVAVVTNKDDKCAVPMIKRFFGDSVDICRGVRKDGERKPCPEVTLSVLDALGVTPDEALFVGDGMADLNVARNCNIDFVPVGYGYTPAERLFDGCGIEPVRNVFLLRNKLLGYFNKRIEE